MIGTDNAKEENTEDFNETQQTEKIFTEKNKRGEPDYPARLFSEEKPIFCDSFRALRMCCNCIRRRIFPPVCHGQALRL